MYMHLLKTKTCIYIMQANLLFHLLYHEHLLLRRNTEIIIILNGFRVLYHINI